MRAEDRVEFGTEQLERLGGVGEEVVGPGDGARRGVVAGKKEGFELVY